MSSLKLSSFTWSFFSIAGHAGWPAGVHVVQLNVVISGAGVVVVVVQMDVVVHFDVIIAWTGVTIDLLGAVIVQVDVVVQLSDVTAEAGIVLL